MKNELSSIFKKVAFNSVIPVCKFLFSHNERYTKGDGSKYHSSPLKSVFEKAAFKAYAATTGIMVGGDLLMNGQYDGDATLLLLCITIGGLGIHITNNADKRKNKTIPFKNRAIDTQGRDLNRAQLGIMDVISLHISRKHQLIGGTFQLALAGGASVILSPYYSIIVAPYIADAFDKAYRAHMILKGHDADIIEDGKTVQSNENGYVICDTPPAKTATAKSQSLFFGGATKPSL